MKTYVLFALASLACLVFAFGAEPALPPIQGPLPQEAVEPFQYGEARDGLRIGLSSAERKYRLNHCINVWSSIAVVGAVLECTR